MRRQSRLWLPVAAIALAVPAALGTGAVAFAAWSASGSGPGGAAAATMPPGAAPSGSGSFGTATISWSAVTLADGAVVGGYKITRYDINGTGFAANGTCAGVVTTTSCSERSVPAGTYTYTDTPVLNTWTGGESPQSNAVIVH